MFVRLALVAGFITSLLPTGRAADISKQVAFDIEAGEAEATLKAFTEQSGQQVIYPTALVQRVKTGVVKGSFPVREALDRMLAGSGLSAWQDEQTGALAIKRRPSAAPVEAAQAEGSVLLPPFVLEEKLAHRWTYATVPGMEVLSLCPDGVTLGLVEQFATLHMLLEVILPKHLQYRSDIPTTCLFFSESGPATVSREFLSLLERREAGSAAAHRTTDGKFKFDPTIGVLPNFRFWDQDAVSVFCVWDVRDDSRLMLTPSYVRFVLENRTPALPPWFIEGMMELYRRVIMNTRPVSDGGVLATFDWGSFLLQGTEPNTVTIQQPFWVSEETTDRLWQVFGRIDFELALMTAGAEPLPLEELFSNEALTDADKLQESRGRCTAALFIRWMLSNWKPPPVGARWRFAEGSSARALWKFVERSCVQQPTESLFRECFGVGYMDAEFRLRDYLYATFKSPLILRPASALGLGPVNIREAREAEVSRIKGDFNRLEIAYIRAVYPELTSKYVDQARRTLSKSYKAGDRDPRLLAQLGLCECDAGDDAAATPFLESAVQARVVRPRAYYELARIRFATARGKEGKTKLTAEQLSSVLEPLFLMRGQAPALGEAYELMAEAWLRSETMPAGDQLSILAEGVKLFPRRTRLLLSAALIYATLGRLSESLNLIEQGMQMTSDAGERARFQKLKAAVPARSQ